MARGLMKFCLAAACSLSATSSIAAAPVTPFKGRITGEFVSTPTGTPAIFHSVAQAQGNGTHIGRFTKITDDTFNFSTGEVTGSFTMTTANGDLLRGSYHGFVVPNSATTFTWSLDATIDGGTGRFEDATGAFVFLASGSFTTVGANLQGTYTETYEGTISYGNGSTNPLIFRSLPIQR